MAWIVPDFETRSACDLKACGAWRYAEDPSTEVLCLSWEWNDGRKGRWNLWEPPPEELFQAIRDGVHFCAHNVAFEKAIWRHQMMEKFGWPAIPQSQWWDTMAVCAMRVIPLGLDRATQVLRLPAEKDNAGSKFTVALSKFDKAGNLPLLTPAVIERVQDYCDDDVSAQVGLLRRIGWLPEGEGRVYQLNQRINDRGIRLDLPLIAQMRKVVDQATAPLAEEFRQITGFNFTQNAKVKDWVNGRGVMTDSLDKEHMAELLGADIDESADEVLEVVGQGRALPDDVRRALEIKQLIGSASIKKLERMQKVVNFDGRARGLLQYHGTGPGRQTSKLFQIHNFPKGIIKGGDGEAPDIDSLVSCLMTGDADWVEMCYGAPVHAVLSALRHTIIPAEGHEFIAGDYSGIQARLILSLAGQYDKVQMMADGLDVYISSALDTFPELPRVDLRDKDAVKKWKALHPWERGIGKNSVLGLGFRMGAATFQFKYAKDHPLEFCQGVVDAYRKDWAPEVPAVWNGLQDAALYCVVDRRKTESYGIQFELIDNWLTMRLHSGRLLWYFNPQRVRKHMPWSTPEKPDIREAWTYQTTKMGKWITVDSHGGKTAENAIMGMERDLMTAAQFKLEREGFPIAFEVHDENVSEPKLGQDINVFKQIMEDVDPWARELKVPVAVDVWAGSRYRK